MFQKWNIRNMILLKNNSNLDHHISFVSVNFLDGGRGSSIYGGNKGILM